MQVCITSKPSLPLYTLVLQRSLQLTLPRHYANTVVAIVGQPRPRSGDDHPQAAPSAMRVVFISRPETPLDHPTSIEQVPIPQEKAQANAVALLQQPHPHPPHLVSQPASRIESLNILQDLVRVEVSVTAQAEQRVAAAVQPSTTGWRNRKMQSWCLPHLDPIERTARQPQRPL